MKSVSCVLAIAGLACAASAAPTLTNMSTFGNNGWRAPNVIQGGDTAGSNNGTNYNYLGTGNLERGMAYNPVTGNLILVSRSAAGNGIRVINGTTGNDMGALNQGSGIITGGTFTTNKVGVSADGQIFVANLQANTNTGALKVYRWANEAATIDATPWFNSTIAVAGTPRMGDSMDTTGSGSNVKHVFGHAGVVGYSIVTGSGATAVSSFTAPAPGVGRFRLGVTFAQNDSNVWGKETSQSLHQTTYSGSAGTGITNSTALTSAGEAPMDYVTIGGIGYLAAMDVNNSRVYIYNMSNPLAPVSLFAFGVTATTGTLAANGNATGDVRWGAVDNGNLSATLYAMSSNQGIQAFTFAVPTPGTLGLAMAGGLLAARRRR
ncbi:MAG: hypothetical protein KGS45_13135 [Planctomycetes bacterium]|nr:hypothetical protein [Planctomycetota bacterium]